MTETMIPDEQAIQNAGGQMATVQPDGPEDGDLDLGKEFDPAQQTVLLALVHDPNLTAAATAAGVTRRTVYRWLQQPAFQAELARQRDAVLTEALDTVKAHATRAAAELAKLLDEKDGRLRRLVCKDILEQAIRVREVEEFGRRLAAVEKRLEDKKGVKQ